LINTLLNKKRGSSEFPLLIVALTDNGPKSPPLRMGSLKKRSPPLRWGLILPKGGFSTCVGLRQTPYDWYFLMIEPITINSYTKIVIFLFQPKTLSNLFTLKILNNKSQPKEILR